MARFEVFADGLFVGWSELENGDPPMGVAYGRFFPTEAYKEIQERVITETASGNTSCHFSIKSPNGTWIEALGISISDYSREVGEDGIEITVAGISAPPYDSLFQNHIDAYNRSFEQ